MAAASQLRELLYVSPQPCPPPLAQHLKARQWYMVQTGSLAAAESLLRRQPFLLAVLALSTVPQRTQEDFQACAEAAPGCEWVGLFASGVAQSPPLRQMVLAYFFDHHTFPVDPHFLVQSLGHAFGRALLRSGATKAFLHGTGDLGMVGHSAAINGLRRLIRKAGPAAAPVLIAGESGTGKELVARSLHDCSARSRGPFVAVSCAGIAPTLIHSELFGHERGAFTGASAQRRGLIEAAHGGTLFLDEIAELPLELQATLLRFLQEKVIYRVGATRHVAADTRVIAASHVDLQAAVRAGRFREDLYYRVNVLQLVVPPLRERRDDIPLLAGHFLERCAVEMAARASGFSKSAIQALVAHDWPGNVRELSNRVQRALLLAEQRVIVPADLGLAPGVARRLDTLAGIRCQAERSAVRSSLDRVSHNVTLAARELGVSRMTLYRLMAKHSITPDPA